MKQAKVTLTVNLPSGVNQDDLQKMVNFQFFGHSISNDDIEKWPYEMLDVEHSEVEMINV